MKRLRKQLPTRRRRALKRLAVLLILVVFLSVFHLYAFLPGQAVWLSEEKCNTGPTEVVFRQWLPRCRAVKGTKPQLMYLSVKGDTALLTLTSYELRIAQTGWNPTLMQNYDCAAGAALSGDAAFLYEGREVVGFLRIGDPTVTEVEVSFQALQEWQENTHTWKRTEVAALRTTAAEWTERDGYRYALLAADIQEWPENTAFGAAYLRVAAYDKEGRLRAEYDSYDETWPW